MDKTIYTDLIPSKNYVKENYMRYVEMVLRLSVNLGTMLDDMDFAFEIDNAAGDQLDTIGELVGLKRLLSFVPTEKTRLMDDDEYRAMLKIKIGRNVWDGTNQGAIELYKKVLLDKAQIYITDNQDMSVYLHIEGTIAHRLAEIISSTDGLVVPAGVRKNIVVHEEASRDEFNFYQGCALYCRKHMVLGDTTQQLPDFGDVVYDGVGTALADGRGIIMNY